MTPEQATVWVDVSDLLMFLSHHAVVSGIQRVLVEAIPHVESGLSCRFVALDEARDRLVVVDQRDFRSVLDDVRGGTRADAAIPERVRRIRHGLAGCPPAEGQSGDVVAILGAGWMFPGLFNAIQHMKDQGAAVLVLLYDLIPVVFPGLPEPAVEQFRQFLPRVSLLADRAPAISRATRRDFETYCRVRDWRVPGGGSTGLAGDQWSESRLEGMGVDAGPAWPRPFVLFVSTVEVRKNHILALRAWSRLIARHGHDQVPDLVCVGRLGWNAFEFLEAHRATNGLNGRVHLLTDSLPDARLAALYRDCMFTVYPSRYEGWGLPVAESLDMGKPVVSARNTSLEEAGGVLARYFPDDDLDGFVSEVDRYLSDPAALAADARRIVEEHTSSSWEDVAGVLIEEIDLARRSRTAVDRVVEVGVEYGVAGHRPYRGGSAGEEYEEYLESQRRLPLTGQVQLVDRAVRAGLLVETAVVGNARRSTVLVARPCADDLVLMLATSGAHMPGELAVEGQAIAGALVRGRGGVVGVPLGAGPVGELAQVSIVGRAGVRRRAPIRSFMVVADQTEVTAILSRGKVATPNRLDTPAISRGRRVLRGGWPRAVSRIRGRLGH